MIRKYSSLYKAIVTLPQPVKDAFVKTGETQRGSAEEALNMVFGVQDNNTKTYYFNVPFEDIYGGNIKELRRYKMHSGKKKAAYSRAEYLSWKRKNVTLRGMKQIGSPNGVWGSFGKGLYTTPLSNASMARQYGKVYFVVNAKPKNPKVVQDLNSAEIFRQNLVNNFCKKHGKEYDLTFFEENTSIEKEMLKLGFDGLVIKGREMVNYSPENVMYFETERELERYFENSISKGKVGSKMKYLSILVKADFSGDFQNVYDIRPDTGNVCPGKNREYVKQQIDYFPHKTSGENDTFVHTHPENCPRYDLRKLKIVEDPDKSESEFLKPKE